MTAPLPELPRLSDGLVLLRAAGLQDLPALEAGIRDPDVLKWIGPQPASAREVLRQNEERWAHGSPTFSICEIDGTCVGKVWLNVREAEPGTGYVGYWLLPAARGRGLATPAVRLISAWGFRGLGLATLRLTTAPDNERSQRVADRSGYRRLVPPPGEGLDGIAQVIYEHEGSGGVSEGTSVG